jgi:hypothetical protein
MKWIALVTARIRSIRGMPERLLGLRPEIGFVVGKYHGGLV